MKSYYERSDGVVKRLLGRSRRNDNAYNDTPFALFMPIPYWAEEVEFLEGILLARKEDKTPPFDLGQQVEVIVNYARHVAWSEGPRLKRASRYFVKRVVYLGRDWWKMQMHDVVPGGSAYYNTKSFRRVPN